METVSQQLGHKKIEVTQRHYNEWILERQQNMEAVVRNSLSRIGHVKKTNS
jgi:integrase